MIWLEKLMDKLPDLKPVDMISMVSLLSLTVLEIYGINGIVLKTIIAVITYWFYERADAKKIIDVVIRVLRMMR